MRYDLYIKMHIVYPSQINVPGKDKAWSEHKKTNNSINNNR
jgi:hypothetical protein